MLSSGLIQWSTTTWENAGFPYSWGMDGLSAFFFFVLLVGYSLASLYAWGYVKEFKGRKSLRTFAFFWVAFFGSMLGVILAGDGFTFLFMWELMSLFSFFLVMYEHEERSTRKAAFIYLSMTHMGTLFLTAAFLFLYAKSGSFAFVQWAQYVPNLSPAERNLLFASFLIGFGTKAGFVPLHIWLPYAHSKAPGPVSAVMSGVMVKIALYGFLRLAWVTLGTGPAYWGWLLLGVGALSALVGILFAAVESDIKRALAFSTVENVGILGLALGIAFLNRSWHYEYGMLLGLVAFFWHTVQHMLYKSTLFMGAGNVMQSAHQRSLERLGGLTRKLPQTSIWALFAVAGLAALPPLGGFWGEWLILSSLWESARQLEGGWGKVVLPLVMALLGLIAALALAALAKWYGVVFLGQARSREAKEAVDVSLPQKAAMFLGVGIALSTVLWPQGILTLIRFPLVLLTSTESTAAHGYALTTSINLVSRLQSFSQFVLLYVLLFGVILATFYLISRGAKRRVSATWNCGGDLTPRMQYTATGVTKPIRVLFSGLLGSKRQVVKEFAGTRYILSSLRYHGEVKAVFEDAFYRPTAKTVLWLAKALRYMQAGNIHLYLGYLLVTLVLVLIIWRT